VGPGSVCCGLKVSEFKSAAKGYDDPKPIPIYVGKDGKRFIDESIRFDHGIYKIHGVYELCPVPVPIHMIFDEKRRLEGPVCDVSRELCWVGVIDGYTWSKDNLAELKKGWIIRSNTIRELAKAIGKDDDALEETINKYNKYCAEGKDLDYGRPAEIMMQIEVPPWDIADHEGDWATIQLLYDPAQERIVKVFHYAHGDEMQFDMATVTNTEIVFTSWGKYKEYRGPNYGKSFDDVGATAQNNTVRFYQDSQTLEYTHPVVYIEYGSHEFWPTQAGSYKGFGTYYAPPHKGDDLNHRYLTEAPLNLGEVEANTMVNATAEIILKYNGIWGTYNRKNWPPAGPPLHTEWTWPANSKIRPFLKIF
jgi:hypothetical protein